jgi:hypothetical protein
MLGDVRAKIGQRCVSQDAPGVSDPYAYLYSAGPQP